MIDPLVLGHYIGGYGNSVANEIDTMLIMQTHTHKKKTRKKKSKSPRRLEPMTFQTLTLLGSHLYQATERTYSEERHLTDSH